ncbi:VRR-NUC domain-containing protein [Enterovibrio sp. ZSDZ35]|uniref:phosphodiesterase I n=1 Tax=Enterovibrio qingdaonensis TaxID=2899818 RepID=A0ABT5QRX4_9GAMM|nr:VRR-NUC domain-containing protein [Enterovibrio sp. ZSDZ35]MDD1783725.1 VRR-NUC domain-containing protein [Enterovibrio sp. ZSDZ35]
MADTAVTNPLPPLYYLDNFLSIIDTVSSRYPDLLSSSETDWIVRFKSLPLPAQALLVRMLSRKGNWFREDKFAYSEIPNISDALDALASSSLVTTTTRPNLNVLVDLHTKPELITLFETLTLKASAKKTEIVDVIVRQADSSPTLGYRCIEVSHDVMPVFLLLYFGNAHQNLSEFVVSDLGIYQYESVPLNIRDRLFNERHQIEAWLALSSLYDEYWQTVENKQRDDVLNLLEKLPAQTDWPPLAHRRNRLVNLIARDLERLEQHEQAKALYLQSHLPPARERLARIALMQGDIAGAADVVEQMRQHPDNENESEVAERLARQLAKKGAMQCQPKTKNAFSENTVTLEIENSVEQACADHFRQQGWQVWFSENLILNGLFGLAFWDIIFIPTPGAFMNPFQRGPKDMYLPEFTQVRKTEIQARLHTLTSSTAQILDTYDAKKGLANDWVYWDLVDREIITAALNSLSSEQLIACFERILFDRKNNRSGHPDLFMVKNGHCQFVEVKGPGDKLQHHQIRWLNFMNQHGIAANVLYVKRPDH